VILIQQLCYLLNFRTTYGGHAGITDDSSKVLSVACSSRFVVVVPNFLNIVNVLAMVMLIDAYIRDVCVDN
jgi:hypothetical protein